MTRTSAFSYRGSAWLAILLAGLMLGPPARAAEGDTQWYDVEIIVFAQAGAPYRDTEDWPVDPLSPAWRIGAQSVDFPLTPVAENETAAGPAQQPYLLLGPEEMHLDKEYQRLKQTPQYRPLLHMAWRQPGLSREQALPMAIRVNRSDLVLPDTSPEPKAAEPGDSSPSGADTAASGEQAPEVPVLEGTVRLVLSRYLHLEVDLTYHDEAEQDSAAGSQPGQQLWSDEAGEEGGSVAEKAGGPPLFRLQEARRMRSREVHYLDHPMFGVIAVATPVEPPPQPLEKQTPPPQPKPPSRPAG